MSIKSWIFRTKKKKEIQSFQIAETQEKQLIRIMFDLDLCVTISYESHSTWTNHLSIKKWLPDLQWNYRSSAIKIDTKNVKVQ